MANASYSVLYQYVGKMVGVKLGSRLVEIYLDCKLIKTHIRGERGQRLTDWNDYPTEKGDFLQAHSPMVPLKSQPHGATTRETVKALLKE